MLDKGLQLGLVTNKPSQFTEALLLKKSLNNYFDVVVSGDTCAHKKVSYVTPVTCRSRSV